MKIRKYNYNIDSPWNVSEIYKEIFDRFDGDSSIRFSCFNESPHMIQFSNSIRKIKRNATSSYIVIHKF